MVVRYRFLILARRSIEDARLGRERCCFILLCLNSSQDLLSDLVLYLHLIALSSSSPLGPPLTRDVTLPPGTKALAHDHMTSF